MNKFRPLLAAPIDDESQLKLLHYPLIGSPKIDGVRVLIHPDLGPVTRSLKPVRNHYIWERLNQPSLHWLDGEVCVGANSGEGVFARSISGIQSYEGEPLFTYHVFDSFLEPRKPYKDRLANVSLRAAEFPQPNAVSALEFEWLDNVDAVIRYEKECLEQGFEGIMLRHPMGIYKYNRSTFNQEILLKLKRFKDDEATIVGFEELYHNQNEQVEDERGYADRSSHKAGMVPGGTLGAIIVSHQKFGEFSIGSGFDSSLRMEIWSRRDYYRGKRITFKYQEVGVVDKPRFPIFKGFRPQE